MNDILQNPSLIRGLLREISVLRVAVQLSADGTKREVLIALQDDHSRSSGTSFSVLSDSEEHIPIKGTLSFQLDGQYYEGEITKTEPGSTNYLIPECLRIIKRRRKIRNSAEFFSKSPLIAEISRDSFRATGLLIESDEAHTVLNLGRQVVPLAPRTKVRVRAFAESKEVLHFDGQVSAIRSSNGSLIVVVVTSSGLEDDVLKVSIDRAPRTKLHQGIQLRFSWPTKDGLSFALQLEDTATFGASGTLVGYSGRAIPPVGAICELHELGLRAKLVWREADRAGFDFRYNERAQLILWIEAVERWTQQSLPSLPAVTTQRKILSMMLRSGYLKGKRTRPLDAIPAPTQLPIIDETGTWIRRFTGSSDLVDVDTHVSFIRVSDYSWLIQELGHSSSMKGLGKRILTSAIREFYFREEPTLRPRDVLVALYDPGSKFNQDFWETRKDRQETFFSEAWVVDLTDEQALVGTDARIVIATPNRASWPAVFDELRKAYGEFLLYALGLGADSFSSETLRERLNDSGLEHTRNIVVTHTSDGQVGFVVQLGLPPFSNLTGLAEALWIGLGPGSDLRSVIEALRKDPRGEAMMVGATDAIVFISGSKPEDRIRMVRLPSSPRLFHFQAINEGCLLEYLGAPPTESAAGNPGGRK